MLTGHRPHLPDEKARALTWTSTLTSTLAQPRIEQAGGFVLAAEPHPRSSPETLTLALTLSQARIEKAGGFVSAAGKQGGARVWIDGQRGMAMSRTLGDGHAKASGPNHSMPLFVTRRSPCQAGWPSPEHEWCRGGWPTP